jgi:hypothetical protein
MKIDLSSLPKEFIDGINTIKIIDNFDAKDRLNTKGKVHIFKCINGYHVVCGGTYMNKNGVFEVRPSEEADEEAFLKERFFESIEDAWNTFASYHNLQS